MSDRIKDLLQEFDHQNCVGNWRREDLEGDSWRIREKSLTHQGAQRDAG